MSHRSRAEWLAPRLIGLMAAAVALGTGCTPPAPDTVTIELANLTEYPVEPRLFVDPDPDIAVVEDLIRDDNWVLIDPPLQADELATLEFRCEEVGTMTADYAELLLSDTEYIPSDNAPWLVRGTEFDCGDIVTIIFIDDGQVFFTRVEVNGQFVTDR